MEEQILHILLVEDEEAHAELVCRAFESQLSEAKSSSLTQNDIASKTQSRQAGRNRFHLTVARSLQEARACLKESPPDLIITDLVLPDGHGTELLPTREGIPALPVVVMTSHGDEQVAVEAMKVGALDYVVKSAVALADMRHIAERALREWRHITERKQSERALVESNRRLEETLEELRTTQQQIIQQERLHALGQMASGIVHDFNNAIAPILGFSELLLNAPENLRNTEKVSRYVGMMNTAARDAANVVRRLREFYRHREDDEVFLPIDLNKMVMDTISLTQPKWESQAQASGTKINIESRLREVSSVAGVESALREVLTNLVFNAVDAMPDGGTIRFRTWPDDQKVVLEVSDTGMGMTEEVRQRCFEPFFSTKEERGTGLGLATVYGIIQRHRGTIDIQSRLSAGTTFTIYLPVHQSPDRRTDNRVKDLSAGRSQHVLVVEDKALVRQMVIEFLSVDNHTFEVATNGREGLEKFASDQFDLVVTDRAMPDMNGDQLVNYIKQFGFNTPVIMLTGFGDMMQVHGEHPTGVDAIVAKPVTLRAFREALAKVEKNTQVVD